MKDFLQRQLRRAGRGNRRSDQDFRVFLPMLLLFLGGAAVGCVAGLYLSPAAEGPMLSSALPDTFWEAAWSAGQFFLLLLALSSSWLGLLLTPAAAFLRGYLLSCSVATLYASGGWEGLLRAGLIIGVPALLLVPCFLIAAGDAMTASGRLFNLRFGRGGGPAGHPLPPRIVICGALVLFCSLYSYFLLPTLLGTR